MPIHPSGILKDVAQTFPPSDLVRNIMLSVAIVVFKRRYLNDIKSVRYLLVSGCVALLASPRRVPILVEPFDRVVHGHALHFVGNACNDRLYAGHVGWYSSLRSWVRLSHVGFGFASLEMPCVEIQKCVGKSVGRNRLFSTLSNVRESSSQRIRWADFHAQIGEEFSLAL